MHVRCAAIPLIPRENIAPVTNVGAESVWCSCSAFAGPFATSSMYTALTGVALGFGVFRQQIVATFVHSGSINVQRAAQYSAFLVMKFLSLSCALLALLSSAFAAFGVTSSGSNLLVDSGAGLVTTTNTATTSINFNGKQLQDSTKFTQLSSGLGSATVTSSVVDVIKITISTSTITQYYVVLSAVNTICVGSFASAEPIVLWVN
ncbi:Rhamnogalacturonase B, N-terminal-domain-containing protein [Mycena rosella]|uniref:Rhamnogalacturonase B, N-terminal-domain-containing protein n=1 Tax=Mycena rosella TaxID=1033263 RepID=A0AAD7GI34_MYCRO|nr:Rhamnogalacturonase B, N-terminal-domain-containing protein [Mycena rosella]